MMKFDSADCMKNGCLLHDVPCIKFAVGSGLKNTIGSKKLVAINSGMNIQLVSTKHFFQIVQKRIQGLFVNTMC